MSKLSRLIRSIKEKLFGGEREQAANGAEPSRPRDVRKHFPDGSQQIPEQESFVHSGPLQPKITREQGTVCTGQQATPVAQPAEPPRESKIPVIEATPPTELTPKRQHPHLIQIGFDFGTSFSKCICRDVMLDKAWVHIPDESKSHNNPFLIPSVLLCRDGNLESVKDPEVHYPPGGLYHLKHALVQSATKQLDDPVLSQYRRTCESIVFPELPRFVETCAVYFLAGALGAIRNQVRERMPDFGTLSDDYMAVNLAVPVADAGRDAVNRVYHGILCEAWSLADTLSGYPSISVMEMESLRQRSAQVREEEDPSITEACYIYPEVSANVQGFVRSRVSSPGIYLFSDTGAGTVDQSTFIFIRKPDGTEHLTYLHGCVLPHGSSRIEFEAARIEGGIDSNSLEKWRKKKEGKCSDMELDQAKNAITEPLTQGTTSTLGVTKSKLFVKEQLKDIQIIFGGGGHCEHPYEKSVIKSFSSNLFARPIDPPVLGLPAPSDLDLEASQQHWLGRLAVAYGLSFAKGDLHSFTYPVDVAAPEPEQIWYKRRDIREPPSKDQC